MRKINLEFLSRFLVAMIFFVALVSQPLEKTSINPEFSSVSHSDGNPDILNIAENRRPYFLRITNNSPNSSDITTSLSSLAQKKSMDPSNLLSGFSPLIGGVPNNPSEKFCCGFFALQQTVIELSGNELVRGVRSGKIGEGKSVL